MSEERKEEVRKMFEKFDALPERARAYVEGFAAGVNATAVTEKGEKEDAEEKIRS